MLNLLMQIQTARHLSSCGKGRKICSWVRLIENECFPACRTALALFFFISCSARCHLCFTNPHNNTYTYLCRQENAAALAGISVSHSSADKTHTFSSAGSDNSRCYSNVASSLMKERGEHLTLTLPARMPCNPNRKSVDVCAAALEDSLFKPLIGC